MDGKLLASLGLNGGEVKIYKAVLRAGSVSPAALAKATGIKRTTAYAIARGLAEKRLLAEDVARRPRTFSPARPEDMKRLIAEERERFDVRERLLSRFADELARSQSEKTYPVPKVRFVEEDKLERFQRGETHKWHDSLMAYDATWWGFQDHTWVEAFPGLFEWMREKGTADSDIKFLSNRSEIETKVGKKYPRREIKFWNRTERFLSSLWIAGEYVVIVNTRKKPFYLVEIHDATLANDLREVFKNLWELV